MRINDVSGMLVSLFMDWSGVLANLNHARIGNTIAWNRFEHSMVPHALTLGHVAELATRRQYTFQVMEDGSVLQLLYTFNAAGDSVIACQLAYYAGRPAAALELQAEEEGYEEVGGRDDNSLVPWIRVDYDPIGARGVLHGDCHLHMSGLPEARLLVCGVPNPKQFVEFILAVCYPETYRTRRLHENGEYVDIDRIRGINDPSIACGPIGVFEVMTHIRVPAVR